MRANPVDVKSLVPETAVWEITLNCNMQCIHCGSTAIPGVKREAELTTGEALDLIHQLNELGTKRVVLSGGEPFIRKDWETLATEVARLGMTPCFISNGFLVNDAVAAKIKKLGSDAYIGISIDGTEPVHDHIRQRKGSHVKALGALKALENAGVQCSVITQVNKLNFGVLSELRDIIFRHGIYAWQVQLATPWGRLTKDMVLSDDEYLKLLEFITEQKKILGDKITAADDMGYFTHFEEVFRPGSEWQGCHAGIRNIGITSNGNIMGCLSLQDPAFIEGNIRKTKLSDIWYNPDGFSYNRKFKESDLQGYCRECHHRMKCKAGCHNTGYSITGSLFENKYCAYRILMQKRP
jgi:radical SAM protein with 4Fe4S-binding SPASM domain